MSIQLYYHGDAITYSGEGLYYFPPVDALTATNTQLSIKLSGVEFKQEHKSSTNNVSCTSSILSPQLIQDNYIELKYISYNINFSSILFSQHFILDTNKILTTILAGNPFINEGNSFTPSVEVLIPPVVADISFKQAHDVKFDGIELTLICNIPSINSQFNDLLATEIFAQVEVDETYIYQENSFLSYGLLCYYILNNSLVFKINNLKYFPEILYANRIRGTLIADTANDTLSSNRINLTLNSNCD